MVSALSDHDQTTYTDGKGSRSIIVQFLSYLNALTAGNVT